MKKIGLSEEEIKQIITDELRAKVATRYSYDVVDKLVYEVMSEESAQDNLRKFVRQTLEFLTNDKQFEKSVKEAFQHRVAKSMVAKLEGTVEKAVDTIRREPTLKAEMILAIERIIKNSTSKKKTS